VAAGEGNCATRHSCIGKLRNVTLERRFGIKWIAAAAGEMNKSHPAEPIKFRWNIAAEQHHCADSVTTEYGSATGHGGPLGKAVQHERTRRSAMPHRFVEDRIDISRVLDDAQIPLVRSHPACAGRPFGVTETMERFYGAERPTG